ncbi:MAG: PSD1 and planctomycete cytochrome C domain-containing protein [Pirellulaceae bacterium]|nr:PSD1 and planctomycete cytochrome C domain-containing protein [Pirellulaceae bacterium]
MMLSLQRLCALLSIVHGCLVLATVPCASAEVDLPLAPDKSPLTFERDIRPIFRAHCFDCHGSTEELRGQLDLRLVRFMKQGGKSGPAIVPGNPAQSYLWQRVHHGEMPPSGQRLPAKALTTLRRWIEAGALTARSEPEQIPPGLGITPEERNHWAFQPVRRPEIGDADTLTNKDQVRTPVDALLLRAMPAGLAFSPDADRNTLVRRAYLILLGLPPTPEDVDRWGNDNRTDWYDRLITNLFESPHYGERWARHWLDVAGYADSEGYTAKDPVRNWAWKYRDWVIRAFNQKMPFDEFVIKQLAGDELAGPWNDTPTANQIELLTATGYLRMAADGSASGDRSATSCNQVMTDTLKIISTSLLGLSVHCAQCHDHRYDPIPQTDYYALRAIFEPALDWQAWKAPRERQISLYTPAERELAQQIESEAQQVRKEKQIKQDEFISAELEKNLLRVEDESLRDPLKSAFLTPTKDRTPEQKQLLARYPFVRQLSPGSLYLYNKGAADKLKEYDKRIREIRGKKPPEEFVRALVEPAGHLPETQLFHRGNHDQPRQTVRPASLTISSAEHQRVDFPENDESLPTSGRRLAYAKWLTNGKHPLLARVAVNRLWLHHFGKALVATPGEFGHLGTEPSHPELLDWLADEFVRQGWSWQRMHRLIMHSTVWLQSCSTTKEQLELDPANVFFARRPMIRLEAEAIRDRMLAISGNLDRQLFGKPSGIKKTDTGEVIVDGEQKRRSIYIQIRRTQPVAMLKAFDAPVMETNCNCRSVSTVATQSLMLMNGAFVLRQAKNFAQRVASSATPLPHDRLAGLPTLPNATEQGLAGPAKSTETILGEVVQAWRLAYARSPSDVELQWAAQFLIEQLQVLYAEDPDSATDRAMTNLCHALVSSNEFLYID